jgi:hypothetical protein
VILLPRLRYSERDKPGFNLRNSAELTRFDAVVVEESKECAMANNKNPNEKQPGEKAPGKYHYNPGNMSGKTVKTGEEGSEKKNKVDQSRDEIPEEHS